MARTTAEEFRRLFTSEDEGAHRQQAQPGRSEPDRADGLDTESGEAEGNGGGDDQDDSHGGAVPVSGACSCVPVPTDPVDCTCAIGALIDEITRVAYWANPDEAADALRRLIEQAPGVLARQNEKLIVRLSKGWTGTSREFEKRFNYSRGRLHAMGVRWRR